MLSNHKKFENYVINGDITPSVLNIISNSSYFNAKKIRYALYNEYGITLRGRPYSQIDVSTNLHLKMILSSRIGHITRKLKKGGYVKKINQRTWKRITEININDPDLYIIDKKKEKRISSIYK